MADVADERLLNALLPEVPEHIEHRHHLIVGYDPRQYGDYRRAVFDKGLHRLHAFMQHLNRDIQKLGPELSKLRRKLGCRAHLIDSHGILYRQNALGLFRHGERAALGRHGASLGKAMQELSSKLVHRRKRQKRPLLYSAHCVDADIRRSAGFVKLLVCRVGARCLADALFGGLCRGIDLMSVVILGYCLHGLAYLCVHDKFHGHTTLLTVDILPAHTGKQLLGDLVIVGLYTEHILFIAVKIALRETVTGKCIG